MSAMVDSAKFAKTDNKRRIMLPKTASPGLLFKIMETGTGYELIRQQNEPLRKARLVKANGMAYLDNGHEITQEDVEQVYHEVFD